MSKALKYAALWAYYMGGSFALLMVIVAMLIGLGTYVGAIAVFIAIPFAMALGVFLFVLHFHLFTHLLEKVQGIDW